MEFKGIEHYDVFEDDVIIFWADISNPPQDIQAIAQEIDGSEFSPDCFGICVNYSFIDKEFYVVTDTDMMSGDVCNFFYIAQDGYKCWFNVDIPQEVLSQVIQECAKIVKNHDCQ